jgi:hypothetical protein
MKQKTSFALSLRLHVSRSLVTTAATAQARHVGLRGRVGAATPATFVFVDRTLDNFGFANATAPSHRSIFALDKRDRCRTSAHCAAGTLIKSDNQAQCGCKSGI